MQTVPSPVRYLLTRAKHQGREQPVAEPAIPIVIVTASCG